MRVFSCTGATQVEHAQGGARCCVRRRHAPASQRRCAPRIRQAREHTWSTPSPAVMPRHVSPRLNASGRHIWPSYPSMSPYTTGPTLRLGLHSALQEGKGPTTPPACCCGTVCLRRTTPALLSRSSTYPASSPRPCPGCPSACPPACHAAARPPSPLSARMPSAPTAATGADPPTARMSAPARVHARTQARVRAPAAVILAGSAPRPACGRPRPLAQLAHARTRARRWLAALGPAPLGLTQSQHSTRFIRVIRRAWPGAGRRPAQRAIAAQRAGARNQRYTDRLIRCQQAAAGSPRSGTASRASRQGRPAAGQQHRPLRISAAAGPCEAGPCESGPPALANPGNDQAR